MKKEPRIPPKIPSTNAPPTWLSGTEISYNSPNFKVPAEFTSRFPKDP